MTISRALRLYLRSNTHLAIAAVAVLGAIAAGIATGGIVAPVLVAAGYLVTSIILLFSRAGAREIVREQEEINDESAEAGIERTAVLRNRLAALRIPDPAVAKAVERITLIAGELIEEERRQGRYVPQIRAGLGEALEAYAAYLHHLDDESSRRRYGDLRAADDGAGPDPQTQVIRILSTITSRLAETGASELPSRKVLRDLDVLEELEEQ
jgi:hypothetical protein